jgi:BASS family bile acid:Na+ symporter
LLKTVVDAGVPALVFFAMVVVGMELTTGDFRRVARQPSAVVAATLGQFVVLPFIGWLLAGCLALPPAIAQGMLLVAACPSGGMANIYTYLARANVALAVTLTAVSCLAAVLTTPLALAVLQAQGGESTGFPVPFAVLARQLFLLLVLPVLIGMGIRRRWPDVTKKHGRTLLGFSIAALAVLLGFVIVQEAEQFARTLGDIAVAATWLTVLAFGAGWATGSARGAGARDRFTVGWSLSCGRSGSRRLSPSRSWNVSSSPCSRPPISWPRCRSFWRRSLCSDACESMTETTPQVMTSHEPLRCPRESDH